MRLLHIACLYVRSLLILQGWSHRSELMMYRMCSWLFQVVMGSFPFAYVTTACELTQPFMHEVPLKSVSFTTRSVTGRDRMDGQDRRWGCFSFVRVEIVQRTQLHTG
jgi:hypothetical protein